MKYTAHLLRHTVKKCPQRIKDTPAVLFYRIPCICIVYFKRLTVKDFSKRTRTSVVISSSEICVICTNLVVRTPKDGRGISQKQVLEQNLSSTDEHGRTAVERYTDVRLLNSLFQKISLKYSSRNINSRRLSIDAQNNAGI